MPQVRTRVTMRRRAWLAAGAAGLALAAPGARAQQGQGHPADRASAQTGSAVHRNDDLQPAQLPALPTGMTLELIVDGDRVFHGKGGCFVCHGTEGQGMPAAGDGITTGLSYLPPTWRGLDSLVTVGMPDAVSRSPIAMPARGARGDLTAEEIRRVAAYVWAISQARGEPWAGGHESHADQAPPGAAKGTAGRVQLTKAGRGRAR